jgi:hypothetical protein
MSAHPHHGDDFAVTHEPDRLSGRAIAISSAILVVFVTVCLVVAVDLTRAFAKHVVLPDSAPPKPELGMIEQTPIRETQGGLDAVAEQRRSLESWGWVDRGRGVARIPIERAMDLVAAEAAEGGAP